MILCYEVAREANVLQNVTVDYQIWTAFGDAFGRNHARSRRHVGAAYANAWVRLWGRDQVPTIPAEIESGGSVGQRMFAESSKLSR